MNASQSAAVFAPVLEPLMVVAPPGSGKTTCLVRRVLHALERGVAPTRLLLLTFSNKAASDMRQRARAAMQEKKKQDREKKKEQTKKNKDEDDDNDNDDDDNDDVEEVQCSTFHAFCLRLCRQLALVPRAATVWGDAETKKALRALLLSSSDRNDAERNDDVRARVQQARALLNRPLAQLPRGSDERALVEAYRRLKEQQGCLDFDDMISIVCERVPMLAQNPLAHYQMVMIDEWQDTSVSQLELVKLFAKCTRGISVVGDPHQSIYAFRGAAFSNWKRLADMLKPRVVYLSTNYRSTQMISSVCQALISYNPVPKLGDFEPEPVLTVRPEKDPVQIVQCLTSADEARFVALEMARLHKEKGIPFSEMAVLFRSNPRQTVSRMLEPIFIQSRVPYTIVAGQGLYEAKVVKQVLSYLRFLLNPKDEMAFDVIAKHQKLPKSFSGPWKAYRGKDPSSVALQRFTADRSSVLSAHRETLLKLARLFSSWNLNRVISLSRFVRSVVLEETGGFDWRDESTAEKLNFLLEQMEEMDVAEETLETQLISFLEQIALFAPSERKGNEEDQRCSLSTIHQSKGLEWKAVFVIQCLDGVVPSKQALQKKGGEGEGETDVNGVEEERRLFFVAASRAKQFLYLTHAKPAEGEKRSRFLEEMVVGSRKDKITTTKKSSSTEFSSASSLFRASSSGKPSDVLVQRVWPEQEEEAKEEAEDNENGPTSPKRAKSEPSPVISKPRDAFSVLMHRK